MVVGVDALRLPFPFAVAGDPSLMVIAVCRLLFAQRVRDGGEPVHAVVGVGIAVAVVSPCIIALRRHPLDEVAVRIVEVPLTAPVGVVRTDPVVLFIIIKTDAVLRALCRRVRVDAEREAFLVAVAV